MNETVENGVKTILSSLDDPTLLSLATTVTQGLLKNVKVESSQEAISAIIRYSSDAATILKRKAVTREILFSYLYKQNIETKGLTKNELIDKILNYWQSSEVNNTGQVNPESIQRFYSNENNGSQATDNIFILTEEFVKWFYTNLNSNEILTNHFFEDARLIIRLNTNGQISEEVIENDSVKISEMILTIKNQHGLYFNPNVTPDGIYGKIDVHGLVQILACGTLHTNNLCVGVFEQIFLIAKDPFSENNWKIKGTELNLTSKSDVLRQPKLIECTISQQLKPLTNY